MQSGGLAAETPGTWSVVNGQFDLRGALIHWRVGSGRCIQEKVALVGDTLSHSKVGAAFSQKPLPHRNDAEYVIPYTAGIYELLVQLDVCSPTAEALVRRAAHPPSYLGFGEAFAAVTIPCVSRSIEGSSRRYGSQ